MKDTLLFTLVVPLCGCGDGSPPLDQRIQPVVASGYYYENLEYSRSIGYYTATTRLPGDPFTGISRIRDVNDINTYATLASVFNAIPGNTAAKHAGLMYLGCFDTSDKRSRYAMHDIGAIWNLKMGYPGAVSESLAINNLNQVVGVAGDGEGNLRPFFYDAAKDQGNDSYPSGQRSRWPLLDLSREAASIPTLVQEVPFGPYVRTEMRSACRHNAPDPHIQALDINDAGQIIGTAPGCLCERLPDDRENCDAVGQLAVRWTVTGDTTSGYQVTAQLMGDLQEEGENLAIRPSFPKAISPGGHPVGRTNNFVPYGATLFREESFDARDNVHHFASSAPNNDWANTAADMPPRCGVNANDPICATPVANLVTVAGSISDSSDPNRSALWVLDGTTTSRIQVPVPANHPNSKNNYTEILPDASVLLGMNTVVGPRMWYWTCRATCPSPTTLPNAALDAGICATGRYCEFDFKSMPRLGGTTQLSGVEAMSNRGQVVGGNGYDPLLVTPSLLVNAPLSGYGLPLCP